MPEDSGPEKSGPEKSGPEKSGPEKSGPEKSGPAKLDRVIVEVDGRQLQLTNLHKVLYPHTGFTKGAVIDYYTRIAPVLLPHLAHRALTVKRYPNGVDAKFFFEKNATRCLLYTSDAADEED